VKIEKQFISKIMFNNKIISSKLQFADRLKFFKNQEQIQALYQQHVAGFNEDQLTSYLSLGFFQSLLPHNSAEINRQILKVFGEVDGDNVAVSLEKFTDFYQLVMNYNVMRIAKLQIWFVIRVTKFISSSQTTTNSLRNS
jgi:hypothetical protein